MVAPSAEAMRIWMDVIVTGAEGYTQFMNWETHVRAERRWRADRFGRDSPIITDSSGPPCFQSTADTPPCLLRFILNLTLSFHCVDVFSSTFFMWFCLDSKREPMEDTHTLTHTVYKPKCIPVKNFKKPFYIAKWRSCSYCLLNLLYYLFPFFFFLLVEKIAKWHNANVLRFPSCLCSV